MKKACIITISFLIITMTLFGCAQNEIGQWTCSSCGTKNIGNFCNNCGTAKPGIEPSAPLNNYPVIIDNNSSEDNSEVINEPAHDTTKNISDGDFGSFKIEPDTATETTVQESTPVKEADKVTDEIFKNTEKEPTVQPGSETKPSVEENNHKESKPATEEVVKKHLPGEVTVNCSEHGEFRQVKCQDCNYYVSQSQSYILIDNEVGWGFNGDYCYIDGKFYPIEKRVASGEFYDNLRKENPYGPQSFEELYANNKKIGFLGENAVIQLDYNVYTIGPLVGYEGDGNSYMGGQMPDYYSQHQSPEWQEAKKQVYGY